MMIVKVRYLFTNQGPLYIVYNHIVITKTRLFEYIENFTTKKGKFSDKKSDIFHISAQNIDVCTR